MIKKFISIALSLVLIFSVMACPSLAEASERTVLYEEDFEDFSKKVFNENFTGATATTYDITDDTEKNRLNLGKFYQADIVEMPGYDGQPTEVIKITGDSNATDWTTTAGSARITFSGLSGQLSEITSGTIVYELKMYVPADINSGGEAITQSFSTMVMSPIVKSGDYYGVGTSYDSSSKSNIATLAKGQWHKLTYVLLLDEQRVIVYHNDEMTSYKVRKVSSKGYRFQVIYKPTYEGSHIIFDDVKVWHTNGSYSIDGLTAVSSDLKDATDVSRLVKPQVKFSEMLIDKVTDSGATVSKDNVTITSADGTVVEVDSVSLSADKKTLTIIPAAELTWSTTYSVTVKNLINLYQEKISDYTFSFTVMDEPPFASTEPVFTKIEDFETRNQTGSEISNIENGYISANYTITNNHDSEAKDAFMFAILRDNGALKAIEFKQSRVAPRQTLTFNAGFNIDDAYNQSIEIYIWDNLSDRNALAPSYIITKDGISSTAQ